MAKHLACWPDHIDCEHRRTVGSACMLHGEPAKIHMGHDGHPVVAPLNPNLGTVEASWVCVWNVLENRGGNFDDRF